MSFRKIQIIDPLTIGNPETGYIYLGQSVSGLWEKDSTGSIVYIASGSTYAGNGSSGVSGSSGVDGQFYGTNGTSGVSGTSGTSGVGSSGTSGMGTSGSSGVGSSGTSGVSGTSGTSGKTGSSGTSGVNGTFFGTHGTSGFSGSSGSSGLDGGYGGSTRKWTAAASLLTQNDGQFYIDGTSFTSVNTIKINKRDADGQYLTYWLSTLNVGGILKIEKRRDLSEFGIYTIVNGKTTLVGNIFNLVDVVLIAGNGSIISGEEYLISFLTGYFEKDYVAFMTQSGTTAPTATVLKNGIGNIVHSRISAGVYRMTLNGAFVTDKTFPYDEIITDQIGNVYKFNWISTDYIELKTYSVSNLSVTSDDILNKRYISIKVY